MKKITLIKDKAQNRSGNFDMIFTDPPFEMSGAELHSILSRFEYNHLVLIASLHQIIDFAKLTDLEFCFDCVVSHVSPKKSKSYQLPNYLHSNIAYFRKAGVKSAFDRRRVERSDYYSDTTTHYYPTVFHAPKRDLQYKYQKNQTMINDLVGAFNVQSVLDPFAGSGTTALACLEHNIPCTMIENNAETFKIMRSCFTLLDLDVLESNNDV